MLVRLFLLESFLNGTDTLITHRFALDDAVEAFRVASDRSTGAIRVVLET
jgi:threonine dehydrogenase-like Zn-dependent dehydrogenase